MSCGYIWRGVPRKNSSPPGTKLGGGKMEAPGRGRVDDERLGNGEEIRGGWREGGMEERD